MKIEAGDFHNFGNKVVLSNKKAIKPRPVGVEWLFLSMESDLRVLLKNAFGTKVDCLPNLKFSCNTFSPSLRKSEVDLLKVKPLERALIKSELAQIGTIIGLVQWFGLGDLHEENIAFGLDNFGKFIFSPIDIECIFEDYKIPSLSLMLPSYLLEEEGCGCYAVIEHLKKYPQDDAPAIILSAYIDSIKILDTIKKQVYSAIFKNGNPGELASRVIFRETEAYVKALRASSDYDSFFNDEKKQLLNGDVPYFFRFLDSDKVYYWDSEQTYTESSIVFTDFAKMEDKFPLINEAYLSSRDFASIMKYGVAQITRYFDLTKNKNYQAQYRECAIIYEEEFAKIICPEGKLKCKR